jgi:putative MATE family efflux protein
MRSAAPPKKTMRDLTEGNETKGIVLFALPMLLGNVFQQFYNMVDSWVVGRFLGTEALAAVGTNFSVVFLMLALIMGVTMGTSVLVAQYYGARDFKKVRAAVDSGYIFIFWAGLGLTGLGLATAAPILRLLDVPERIMPEATAYLRVIFAGSLATFGYNAVSSILRGLGDSKTPLYFLIVATLVNVALDLLFVAVLGWGVAGAAWATVISQAISFLGALAVLDKRNEFARLDLRAIQFDKAVFAESLRIGLPTGVQQTLVAAGMMALSRVVNGFGAATMAAFAAAGRLDSFASMPAMNLGQALSTFVGQNLGAGKPERVRRGHLSALIVGACISVVTSILVMSLGAPLIAFFSTDAAVIAIGARYLFIVGAFYLLFCTMFINNGVLRGSGDAMIPMINTLLALWVVRIPLAILFSGPLGMGTDGIWLSIPCGWTVGAVFSTWYYRSGKWKNKALIRTKPIVGRDESRS